MLRYALAFFGLVLFFLDCRPEAPPATDAEMGRTETAADTAYPLPVTYGTDSLDRWMREFFRSQSSFQVDTQAYALGDCAGHYHRYTAASDQTDIIYNRYECGEYGFGERYYFLKNNKLIALREYSFEWQGAVAADQKKFLASEKLYYFRPDSLTLLSREKYAPSFSDSTVTMLDYRRETRLIDTLLAAKERQLVDLLKQELRVTPQ